MSDNAQHLPPAAAVVTLTVADFDTWKTVFDANEGTRSQAGMLGHHINRLEDDPNTVGIYFAVSDVDEMKKFVASEELQQVMKEAGVTGPPDVRFMKPLRESIVWDREVPAFIIGHQVADVDAWLEAYDAADALQKAGGIIGHGANVSLDDPSMVIVYHQAESFDDLRSFLDNPDLRAAMEAAGVISEPDVTFVTGGWAKLYE